MRQTLSLPQDIYSVIDNKCTQTLIRDLLRQYRETLGNLVRIGTTKPEMLDNLRNAVDQHQIPKHVIEQMIRDCEENGNQRIFLFNATKNKSTYSDAEAVASELFREDDLTSFPRYALKRNEFVWGDFRPEGRSWTGKIYGHQERLKEAKQEEKNGFVVKYYERREDRIVCVAEWSSPVLQMRISRDGLDSQSALNRRIGILWEMLSNVVEKGDFKVWDLTSVIRKMLQKAENNKDVYSLSDVRFQDSGLGAAEFNTHGTGEALSTVPERAKAIDSYLAGGGRVREVTVHWNPEAANGVFGDDPLRVIVGGKDPNCINIPAATTRRGVQYVINSLRKIAR